MNRPAGMLRFMPLLAVLAVWGCSHLGAGLNKYDSCLKRCEEQYKDNPDKYFEALCKNKCDHLGTKFGDKPRIP